MGQLDCVLDYLAFVAKSKPLSVLLSEAPRKIAACVGAEVASLYLLEGDGDELVLRGNVGFPFRARGKVRLRVGEGLTGMAVELQYPVSSNAAPGDARYRGFPELEEERFPSFVAVPILGTKGPLGAVVVQRRGEQPFTEAEISLIAALTSPISSGLRLARLLNELRDTRAREEGGGTKKITLPGVPVVPGRAVGAIAALRRPPTTTRQVAREEDADAFRIAHEAAKVNLRRLAELADARGLGETTGFINSYLVMLDDQRLVTRTFAMLKEGESLAHALGAVARDATRAANEGGEPFLIERARDLEQLCDALLMMAQPDSRVRLPSKPVVVADQLSIYDLLVSVRAQPAGFVLTERTPRERTKVLLELIGAPAITDVVGAFRWASPGDIALVDGDHGFLIINPSRADIAAFRAERRRSRKSRGDDRPSREPARESTLSPSKP